MRFGIGAYGLSGLFPISFHALDEAGSIEVVAVDAGHVIEAALGYFVTPLISEAMNTAR